MQRTRFPPALAPDLPHQQLRLFHGLRLPVGSVLKQPDKQELANHDLFWDFRVVGFRNNSSFFCSISWRFISIALCTRRFPRDDPKSPSLRRATFDVPSQVNVAEGHSFICSSSLSTIRCVLSESSAAIILGHWLQ